MHHAVSMRNADDGSAQDLGTRSTLRSGEVETVPDGDDPRIGTVLDSRYRIHGCLGQGGMGLVYEAEHVFLKTRVAVKVLHPDMADAESLERLKREAQSASAIGNPHIVDVRDFGTMNDGSTYVVMELIKGVDLLTEIRWQRLPWQRARAIGMQVAEALSAAHDKGIVHRDLKPENVLLTAREGVADFVKIVDFGIARMQGATKLTAAGRVVGTPEYMAPEQCAGVEVDHRADIYALGILLYEMMTQSLPFSHPELVELLRMQLKKAPQPPREVAPDADIPEALEAVILRCLEKRPSRRFQSMSEVYEALDTLVAGEADPSDDDDDPARRLSFEPVGAASVASLPTLESQGAAPSSRRGLMFGLAALATVVGVGLGLAWLDAADPEASAEAVDPPDTQLSLGSPPAPAPVPTAALEREDEAPAATPAPSPSAPPQDTDGAHQITVSSDPARARVYLDDALIGETPLPIRVPSGSSLLSLTLRHPGYRDHAITVGTHTAAAINVVLERRARVARSRPAAEPEANPQVPPSPERSTRRRTRPDFINPWNE